MGCVKVLGVLGDSCHSSFSALMGIRHRQLFTITDISLNAYIDYASELWSVRPEQTLSISRTQLHWGFFSIAILYALTRAFWLWIHVSARSSAELCNISTYISSYVVPYTHLCAYLWKWFVTLVMMVMIWVVWWQVGYWDKWLTVHSEFDFCMALSFVEIQVRS
jgi:hypothetical protein